jgi:hypothetical protein
MKKEKDPNKLALLRMLKVEIKNGLVIKKLLKKKTKEIKEVANTSIPIDPINNDSNVQTKPLIVIVKPMNKAMIDQSTSTPSTSSERRSNSRNSKSTGVKRNSKVLNSDHIEDEIQNECFDPSSPSPKKKSKISTKIKINKSKKKTSKLVKKSEVRDEQQQTMIIDEKAENLEVETIMIDYEQIQDVPTLIPVDINDVNDRQSIQAKDFDCCTSISTTTWFEEPTECNNNSKGLNNKENEVVIDSEQQQKEIVGSFENFKNEMMRNNLEISEVEHQEKKSKDGKLNDSSKTVEKDCNSIMILDEEIDESFNEKKEALSKLKKHPKAEKLLKKTIMQKPLRRTSYRGKKIMEPHKIIGMTEHFGERIFIIAFEDSKRKPETMKASVARNIIPDLVISFYEKHFQWKE